MLHCFSFIIFHLPVFFLKNILQDENVIVLIHRFPCSLMCGDCMPQFHVCVCVKLKLQFATGGNWKSFKRHASSYSIVFWKPSVSSLYFLQKTNQNNTVTFYCKSQRTKNISTLKYTFLIQIGLIIFLFLPFKQFISS